MIAALALITFSLLLGVHLSHRSPLLATIARADASETRTGSPTSLVRADARVDSCLETDWDHPAAALAAPGIITICSVDRANRDRSPSWLMQSRAMARPLVSDHGIVGISKATGRWEGVRAPYWWQSAMVLDDLIRFWQTTHSRSVANQQLLATIYRDNIDHAHGDFIDRWSDDTAWWGITWLAAARYEQTLGDSVQAREFLATAEADAASITAQPKSCGGIEWEPGYPANTISNSEYITLEARLATTLAQPGRLQDRAMADQDRQLALSDYHWLRGSGLINLTTGAVADTDNSACQAINGPLDYTEGETIAALAALSASTGNQRYSDQAQRFISYLLDPDHHLIARSDILAESCELVSPHCYKIRRWRDLAAYKSVVIDAIGDWQAVTDSSRYNWWLQDQALFVTSDAAKSSCHQRCLISMYWAHPTPHHSVIRPSAASQASGLAALTAAIGAPVARF
jgi:hypothetical protein